MADPDVLEGAAAIGVAVAQNFLNTRGKVILTEIDPPGGDEAEVFEAHMVGPPIVSAGYGGWSRVARPKRKALTEWVGRDSISVTFDFLVDFFVENDGVKCEKMCGTLDRMAGSASDNEAPPLLSVESIPAPLMVHGGHRNADWKWFIDNLIWNKEGTIVNRAGNRVRAYGTIIITQFVEDKRLSAIERGKRKAKGGKRKTYTVKRGDTLSKIAARKDVYGDASKWKKIAEANNIRDPKNISAGQVLKIP